MRNILLLLLLSFSFLTNSEAQDTITVEKIWKDYRFLSKRIPGFNFMQDGRHYTRLIKNSIKQFDLTTGSEVNTLLDGNELNGQSGFIGKIDSYHFNEDESIIILESDKESIYRRSSQAYFHIYDRTDKKLTSVRAGDKIMYATLSPDATKIAYVWQNNLYYRDLDSGETYPITTDGVTNKIINGSADWVYEEEFSFAQAFFWSADSQTVAYYKFDETAVPEFTMTKFNNELYPEYVTFKYPKVGEKNAIVSIHTYNLSGKKHRTYDLGKDTDIYIPRIKWTNSSEQLMIYKMNRHQNELELILADTKSGSTKSLLKETSKYYIDITDDIRFLENDKQFIWSSEKSGYNHLYLYGLNGKQEAQLTHGDYDVTSFYGVDEKNKMIFYQAAAKSSLQREVYRAGLNGGKPTLLSPKGGTSSAQFSSTYDYMVITRSTANSPATYAVYDRSGQLVRTIEDNKQLSQTQKQFGVSDVEFFTIKTDEGVALNAYKILPTNFDAKKSYPVLMYVYGGPGSQTVTDSWKGQNYWWFQQLAQQGYMVVSVDNRGTGARGEEFKKMTYLNLGKHETADQIAAGKYLATLPYVDAKRIGIWGWSYGGYMSSLCLLKGNEVFSTAIAVAPVTNWRWYDSVYTERYMRTEDENPDGFSDNSPINFVDRLEGDYLLIHGMGDDNVHWQNTVEMANALIKANKQFDTYFYPNRHHGITGGNARLHLYTKMTNFLLENL